MHLNINREELKIGNEMPLLLKLRLRSLFRRNARTPGRTLIVDTCIIGDFVASLPALRSHIARSGGTVDLLVSPPLKALAENIRGVDRVFTAKSVWDRPIERLEPPEPVAGEYGQVFLLRISRDAAAMLEKIRYSRLELYDAAYFRSVWNIFVSILLKRRPKQWREVCYEMVGMKEPRPSLGFDDIFEFSEKDQASVAALPELNGPGRKVLIHTGSGWEIKLWDNRKWAESLRRINGAGNFRFIFIGGGETEKESFRQISGALDFKVYSLINKLDLRGTLLAMRRSDFFIGVDSGPRNMAHLADLRSVSLLGPAPENFMPTDPRDIVINKFDCRCKSLFYLHETSAIQRVTPEEVFGAFLKLSSGQKD